MKTIAIIGAGFSGTMCAVNLLKNADYPIKVYLIDKDEPGRGVAYAKNDSCLLLNVRADQMGAFPDMPSHFYDWLKKNGLEVRPTDLISRSIYGNYLSSILETAKTPALEIIRDTVIDIDEKNRSLIFKKRTQLKADHIVLASGLQAKTAVDLDHYKNSSENITIVGTGLSMIDALVYLKKINFNGKITAISRHGRLPAHHIFYDPSLPRPSYDFSTNHSLLNVLKMIKQDLKKYEWRLVIDSLRPHNQFLWSHFSEKEKGQFYRYCRSLWDVHRHRMSPEHKTLLDKMISEQKLEIRAVGYRPYKISTNHVIELTGLSLETNGQNELFTNLLAKNIIQKDVHNLGIKSEMGGNVYQNWIYTLGALRRGQLWECTAVPEIRVQARDLALHLLKSI